MYCFDFETAGIESRPNYPPEPVGLAVADDHYEWGDYYGWGHPEGNNSSEAAAIRELKRNWKKSLLCHNAAFDIAVAHEKLGLPLPSGAQINDTMFLAFLLDPYGELSLKPLAERYLGIPPTERDAVRDWLYANKVIAKNVKRWGAHISKAPGDLVGQYAIGDVTRTRQLFEHLIPLVEERGMLPAYRRECAIMPMLLDNSERGIPLDHKRLARDTKKAEWLLEAVSAELADQWRGEIGSTPPANFDSNDELADALESGDLQIELPRTATGKRSVAKDSLLSALPDGKVKALLLYRSALEKSLSTYMRPWLEQGKALHCNWNQVRDYSDAGARTGRLSSSPNLQNLTNPEKYEAVLERLYQNALDSFAWLPNLRSYIAAPPGFELFSLDYSQQELRMLAHFEDGALAEGFRTNPGMDVHEYVRGLIRETTGHDIPRKHVKNINFAKIYGAGVAKLSAQMNVDLQTGGQLISAYERALPSVKLLQRELNQIGRNGEYITTLGKRRYYAEPAAIDEKTGQLRSFEYKLLNYLIQGSSADQTKEAMRLWWNSLGHYGDTRFLLTVHDELVGMAPKSCVKREIEVLRACMVEAFELDVPVLADAKRGKSFGEMKK